MLWVSEPIVSATFRSVISSALTCTFSGVTSSSLLPYEQIEVRISVEVSSGASSGEAVSARVSGGGAVSRSATHTIEVGARERFGIEDY